MKTIPKLDGAVSHLLNTANACLKTKSMQQPEFVPAVYVEEQHTLEVLGGDLTHATPVCGCELCLPTHSTYGKMVFVSLEPKCE